ncbi:MAG: Structural protein [Candidatus Midichloria mitochondrii]
MMDYDSISEGFGAVKNAIESESQFISTGVKDVPASEIANLSTPDTPEVSNPSKAQGKSK